MFKQFKNNNIEVNRGDSFTIVFPINLGSPVFPDYYALQENDKVYLGIMEPHHPFELAIVRKMFDASNQEGCIMKMEFKPTDTEFLMPGRYYYSIKLVRALEDDKEEVLTLLPNTKFDIFD